MNPKIPPNVHTSAVHPNTKPAPPKKVAGKHVRDTVQTNESIHVGEVLTNTAGDLTMVLGKDGNLVLTGRGESPLGERHRGQAGRRLETEFRRQLSLAGRKQSHRLANGRGKF